MTRRACTRLRKSACGLRPNSPCADPRLRRRCASAGVIDSCGVDRASLRALVSAARAAHADNGARCVITAARFAVF
jgi:hypothetical protein